MTEKYIKNNYKKIKNNENVIENRKEQGNIDINELIESNNYNLQMSKKYDNKYILIDDKYNINYLLSNV